MNTEIIIVLAIFGGILVLAVAPALLVLRGQRFWAPWMMVGAVVLLPVNWGVTFAAQWHLGQKLRDLAPNKGGFASSEWKRYTDLLELVAMGSMTLMVLAFIAYAVGVAGVAFRWKIVSQRAVELEAQTARLAVQREGASAGVLPGR